MMRTLLTKTLYDKRWFLFGWALVMIFTVVLTVVFFPSFTQGNTFEELSKSVPGQLKGFIGDAATFHSITGYIAEQLYNIRLPLMFMIMALILAQALTVSDEERGLLRTVTALPMSRTRVLLERWAAGVIIFGLTSLVAAASFWVGAIIINEPVPFDFTWRVFVLSWLFGIAAFTVIYAVGSASGSRALTMTIGLILTMGGFLLSTFAPSVQWLKNWEVLSLMHYSDTSSILKGSLDSINLWILGLLTILSLFIAILLFRRRDIS